MPGTCGDMPKCALPQGPSPPFKTLHGTTRCCTTPQPAFPISPTYFIDYRLRATTAAQLTRSTVPHTCHPRPTTSRGLQEILAVLRRRSFSSIPLAVCPSLPFHCRHLRCTDCTVLHSAALYSLVRLPRRCRTAAPCHYLPCMSCGISGHSSPLS